MDYMEMLASLGVGSAHPGGFSATLEQLEHHPIPPKSKILEVGCGTGRTACYLAKQGHRVTAVDLRQSMLAKARKRADNDGVHVLLLQADVCSLPFEDHSFDVVMAESVSIFADTQRAVEEYYRVLKPGGKLYDREIMALKEVSPDLSSAIGDFYGVRKLFSASEWSEMLQSAGFAPTEVWKPEAFPENMWEDAIRHPDNFQHVDEGAWSDQRIWKISFQYDDIMMRYREYFGFGVAIGTKP